MTNPESRNVDPDGFNEDDFEKYLTVAPDEPPAGDEFGTVLEPTPDDIDDEDLADRDDFDDDDLVDGEADPDPGAPEVAPEVLP